jgi:hypothetical protein
MRWEIEKAEFERVLIRARECVFIDSGRTEVASLRRFTFDDAQLLTSTFADLLQKLMRLSGGTDAHYLVLEPDPVNYFHHLFGKYPFIEIGYGDSSESYLAALNEDPGGSPADAIGTNWWAAVIIPRSSNWFIHLLRSAGDNGGHLWIPQEWTEGMVESHPYLRV